MSDFDFEASDNKDELLAFARTLSLTVDHRYSIEKLREMIRSEYKAVYAQPTTKDIESERKVMLMIHKTEGDTGSIDVPVSINGKTWLIKRGVEVEVPAYVVEVLQNAVKDVYVQDDVTKSIVKREVPAYPFSSRAA